MDTYKDVLTTKIMDTYKDVLIGKLEFLANHIGYNLLFEIEELFDKIYKELEKELEENYLDV